MLFLKIVENFLGNKDINFESLEILKLGYPPNSSSAPSPVKAAFTCCLANLQLDK